MLTLYYKPSCPYCQKVLQAAGERGVSFSLKDVNDPALRAELIEKGGKPQVPYLEDDETGVSMHESSDIIAYIDPQSHPKEKQGTLRIHKSDNACETCSV
jgi:glutathione S-transferase